MVRRCFVSLTGVALILCAGLSLSDDKITQVVFNKRPDSNVLTLPTQLAQFSGPLVLSAPPRESEEEGEAIYGPIASFLTEKLKRNVVYRYSGNWGVYQGSMQKGQYDLVLDGPHFNGWRIARLNHNVLVKVPGDFVFVVFVQESNKTTQMVKQMAGRTFCGHAPPNLGTLSVMSLFDNPARQPVIVPVDGWENIYNAVVAGKCMAGAIPMKVWDKHASKHEVREIYRTAPYPDNALSAGPRVSEREQALLADDLVSAEGDRATVKFRERYAGNRKFVRTSNREYAGLGRILANEWGYD
jgi:hypothetical protein